MSTEILNRPRIAQVLGISEADVEPVAGAVFRAVAEGAAELAEHSERDAREFIRCATADPTETVIEFAIRAAVKS